MPNFTETPNPAKPGVFNIQLTRSAVGKPKPDVTDKEYPVVAYYPESVLEGFQAIIKESSLCGQEFYNPFTEEMERFPEHPTEFTVRHLQFLARNESSNVSGIMDCSLYGGLLTEDQIARIRCLVKGSAVVGKVTATKAYGFGRKVEELPKPEDVIVIDQIGLQWQGDLRNTGGMFFYPQDSEIEKLPKNYAAWQNDMFFQMYGVERRDQPSKENSLELQWGPSLDSDLRVRGVLDLDGVRWGIMHEFHQALAGLVNYSHTLSEDSNPINFKFLKAGMGFFSAGLYDLDFNYPLTALQNDGLAQVELARLKGILSALESYPSDTNFGKVRRLNLPFSAQVPDNASPEVANQYGIILKAIKNECRRLNLEWGTDRVEDALAPVPGYINAVTNCADPHALIGNEGKYSSVDAAISSNIPNIHLLNSAYNVHIHGYPLTPGFTLPKRSKPEVIPQTDVSLFGYVQKLATGLVDSWTKNTPIPEKNVVIKSNKVGFFDSLSTPKRGEIENISKVIPEKQGDSPNPR
ncbi:hypothetical protein [Legionella longbeachae]|uniref:Uncharacterized protein n=1 Tax=Legionella longbeachae serogroup 1 (strain NSW150) TaxID=661367 RepID=D3HMU8_LEGLN|nr:hypothetical protein [Legionella longbeachae]VEE04300.1 Uncharacterised protein [Legionella oakridgensis]HBD7397070.1 hypothetical protein [Legionella pneumophila]ARB92875.1 hypothetical protein A6J40_12120 [Legionella longbeachae]ARM33984.1 hypothetical protein B0B39_10800 [Legionella longbeachae]QIN33886.1 hypothetical protein GCB94_17900 [Legionella longbeachae]